MSEKINGNDRNRKILPFDKKISEVCEKCSGKVIYRKSSFFGEMVYYKICNNCGWYQKLDKEDWREKVVKAMETKAKKKSNAAT